ncbi:MAG: WXG100 family type VII secretion target [Firmicutes bacterium]|nr:WXG100 family type VII secretion target [Bacillota bacterium]
MASGADIQVSVEAKEASKKKFNIERDNIIASLEKLQREVNNVQGWWKGQSGAAFMEKFTQVKAEIKAGIEGCVADYCALMDATIEAHIEADRQLAAKVRNL